MRGLSGITETHCHLTHADFDSDRDAVIVRARDAGVTRLLVIGCDLASSQPAINLANLYPHIQAAIGIHPESGNEWDSYTAKHFVKLVLKNRSKIAAWGEIGLDYHWETVPRAQQKAIFIDQLSIARSLDLPVIIHCREAYSDMIEILDAETFTRAVLHCFTGTIEEAKRAFDLGLMIGVGGILTYKKSDDLRSIIANAPLDRLLLETDCPYLPPQNWRGKRNEPAYLVAVASKIAELHNKTPQEIVNITTENADRFFGKLLKVDPVNS